MSRIAVVLCAWFVVVATGCWPFPSHRDIAAVTDRIAASVGQPYEQPIDMHDEKAVNERIRFLTRELAAAQADKRQLEIERTNYLKGWCLAVAGFSLLAFFAGIALRFLLPERLTKTTNAIVIASAAVFGCALVAYSVIGYLIPMLPWLSAAVGIIAVVGVAVLVVQYVKHVRESDANKTAAKVAADGFDKLETAVKNWADPGEATDMLAKVKAQVAQDQEAAGVREKLAAIRGKPVIA